jgi:hypothetical protein
VSCPYVTDPLDGNDSSENVEAISHSSSIFNNLESRLLELIYSENATPYETYILHIHFIQRPLMGIVKISDLMHENLRVAGNALSRSINAQAEHWMRVGMLTEMHPELDHREICQLLIRAELAGGLDITVAVTPPPGKPRASSTGKH